ncbi:MAG: hypothetical protein J4F36_03705 [Nitrosopumilaceae archaeon]|nr:hypothetical protein [Nitrosopumilaceae archaeon]
MKSRYKITIIGIIVFAVYVALSSWQVCILKSGFQEWIGSNGGCGPRITFELQRFFENMFIP